MLRFGRILGPDAAAATDPHDGRLPHFRKILTEAGIEAFKGESKAMKQISFFAPIPAIICIPAIAAGNAYKGKPPTVSFHYDMRASCGFSASSDRALTRDVEKCTLSYRDPKRSPFFYGSISSNKSFLAERKQIGAIDLSNDTPTSTRIDYYDDKRNVTQHIIRSQHVSFPQRGSKDIIIASELDVTYDKPDKSGKTLSPTKEKYECWDGVFYGRSTAVSLSLCAMRPGMEDSFPSKASWQAKIIKSLSIE